MNENSDGDDGYVQTGIIPQDQPAIFSVGRNIFIFPEGLRLAPEKFDADAFFIDGDDLFGLTAGDSGGWKQLGQPASVANLKTIK